MDSNSPTASVTKERKRFNVPMALTWTRVALIIVGRDIAVTGLREWMAKIGASSHTKVNWYGKVKAIAQMVSIPLLLWYDPLGPINIGEIGSWLIWIAVILTLYSLVIYTKAAIPFLYPDEKLKNQDR